MKRVQQFSVSLENKAGTLADMCQCLAESGVNILAISVVETSEQSLVRMVVDKPDDAATAFAKCSQNFSQRDVLLIDLEEKVGALAELAGKCKAASVNLDFVYGSTAPAGGQAFIVLGAGDLAAAENAIA